MNDVAMHRMRAATCRVDNRQRIKRAKCGGAGRPEKCGKNTGKYIESRILQVGAHNYEKEMEARTNGSVGATDEFLRLKMDKNRRKKPELAYR
jgi:hypothetical protein